MPWRAKEKCKKGIYIRLVGNFVICLNIMSIQKIACRS
jgi:hypothetical protein